MAVELNHTIVKARNKEASARFLTEILGLPGATRFGPFQVVEMDNGVSLDFYETDGEIASQHYAFLITEAEFDEIFPASASTTSSTGPTQVKAERVRSISMTAVAVCTSRTRMGISWRSSPGPMRQRRARPLRRFTIWLG